MDKGYKSGYIAILGRPNVGKSTLLNRLVGEKVSITAAKRQTTRHQILGIHSTETAQYVYVDTPGIHLHETHLINRQMNRVARETLTFVDVVVVMVEALKLTEEDKVVLAHVSEAECPVLLVINKVDRVKDKDRLLPFIDECQVQASFTDIIPLSATKGSNVEALEKTILNYLPENAPIFPPDQISDKNDRFLAAELIREKITRLTAKEVPYAVTVEIEAFEEEKKLLRLSAIIWVEQPGQKAIIIGKKGAVLKEVGSNARREMERLFGKKVFLKLWVKVRSNWSDDKKSLQQFGYE